MAAREDRLGFMFCDDHVSESAQAATLAEQHAQIRRIRCRGRNVITDATFSSSSDEDQPEQSIHSTLAGDNTFWSSTGCRHGAGDELLVYRLHAPLCRIEGVTVCVYRATFQRGHPIYPPVSIGVEVGFSPSSMHALSAPQPCLLTEQQQLFPLPAACMGGFVAVRLYGKRQKQEDDRQYYIAIRFVEALGTPIATPTVADLVRALHQPLPKALFTPTGLLGTFMGAQRPPRVLRSFSPRAAAVRADPAPAAGSFRADSHPAGECLYGFDGAGGACSPAAAAPCAAFPQMGWPHDLRQRPIEQPLPHAPWPQSQDDVVVAALGDRRAAEPPAPVRPGGSRGGGVLVQLWSQLHRHVLRRGDGQQPRPFLPRPDEFAPPPVPEEPRWWRDGYVDASSLQTWNLFGAARVYDVPFSEL